ncbi:MAG: FAD-binding protein [Bacillota bacterium]|nr:FAD-binding protein [Bacillota bacterium]
MKPLDILNGQNITVDGVVVATHHCSVLVVGTGAAGLAAALRLHEAGVADILLLSEDRLSGTSRNTGSDKQTYYKLTLAGDEPDSVGQMAETLFAGGCMDGDLARIEAALSASCFHWLCEKGVPFPRNAYGETVGYKTDHDPLSRASSAGPLTSRLMVECLESALGVAGVQLFDNQQVISLLTDPEKNCMAGVLCLDVSGQHSQMNVHPRYTVVLSRYVVFAVGGPAMVYADTVYPGSQLGGTGLALAVGARAVNLTEWQYGLASIAPRWNVSGSYQQVLPRYLSTDQTGGEPRDFLEEWIKDETLRLDLIFRKGYQWPFDVRKLSGSSLIDLLVYRETVLLNRRVFLDFRSNPGGRSFELASLGRETAEYLTRTGATAERPWQRLRQMNEPAFAFYRSHGIDLSCEPLEIRLCAQHHNGGLAVNSDWESNVHGLYPIGEVCGTHGIYRPGGSALNSGQVGAFRVATRLRRVLEREMSDDQRDLSAPLTDALIGQIKSRLTFRQHTEAVIPDEALSDRGEQLHDRLLQCWQTATERMSRLAGPFRSVDRLPELLKAILRNWEDSSIFMQMPDSSHLSLAWRYRELLIIQRFLVEAMIDYAAKGGGSRGSALYLETGGASPYPGLPDFFRSRTDGPLLADQIQEIGLLDKQNPAGPVELTWRSVRSVPHPDEAFEQVWRVWRKSMNNTNGGD